MQIERQGINTFKSSVKFAGANFGMICKLEFKRLILIVVSDIELNQEQERNFLI